MSPLKLLSRLVSLRALPLLLGYFALPGARAVVDLDVARWQHAKRRDEAGLWALLQLLTDQTHEFRNLYYHRLGRQGIPGKLLGRGFALVYRPELTLFLWTEDIGPGLFIQHGFATIVSAKRIGTNCWINQQVTIGYDSNLDVPVLEDNVVVSAGAIVVGGITLGAGAHVGAGAVVTKDVPAGMVAVGVPAKNRQPGANAKAHGPGEHESA
ncbi:MAG: serine O-acetyltransferase [Frankiales bacterium]|nr:serine O-acetyltransferase [Frankiales bacterium]